MLPAATLDVVPDHAGAQEAAAGSTAGCGWSFGWIIEHVRPAGGLLRIGVMMSVPPGDGFALQDFAGGGGREGVWHLHDDLPFAMRAEALLTGVLVFDFEDVSVRTLDLNTHVRPASRTAEDLD